MVMIGSCLTEHSYRVAVVVFAQVLGDSGQSVGDAGWCWVGAGGVPDPGQGRGMGMQHCHCPVSGGIRRAEQIIDQRVGVGPISSSRHG